MDISKQIEQWQADGTWDRLNRVRADRTPIKIRRSNGEFVDGVIVEVNVRCIVAWGEGAADYESKAGRYYFAPGVLNKAPLAEEILMWNTWLAVGAKALTVQP